MLGEGPGTNEQRREENLWLGVENKLLLILQVNVQIFCDKLQVPFSVLKKHNWRD